jgi:hypothetical protein
MVGFSSLFAIFNRKMQKLPLFSCILIRNEGKTDLTGTIAHWSTPPKLITRTAHDFH